MELEFLFRAIKKEVEEVFLSAPSFNIDENINLLFGVISLPNSNSSKDLDGLESRLVNAMFKIIVDGVKVEDRETFFADFAKLEPLLRKILQLINPTRYSQIIPNKGGLMQLIKALELNPNNLDFEQHNLKSLEGSRFYEDHIIRAYRFKNAESHVIRELSTKDFGLHMQSFLVVYLYVINKWRTLLKSALEKEKVNTEPSFAHYCDTVINDFKSRIGRFIHLSSKENINLSSSYVTEHAFNYENEMDELARAGTVEELRISKVPEKRMIIWGEAGMGKSTTLEYLSYQDALKYKTSSSNKIPVYIQLGLLTEPTVTIKSFIFRKLTLENAYGEEILEKGKLNIFFDGLNEIPKDNYNQLRTLRIKETDELFKKYKSTFFILSNRPQTVNLFKDVPVFMLERMNDKQVKDFIDKYSDGNKIVVQKITNRISTDDRLNKIIKTPLMLSRLIEIVKADGEIPENEGKIIDRFLKSLYKREIIEKQDANFNESYIHKMLSFLGYYSLEEKDTNSGMKENEVLNQFIKCKKEYGFEIDVVYVLDISIQLNILEKRENLYVFSHQSYQDYYSMEYEKMILGL